MSRKAAITVHRSRDEVQRRWASAAQRLTAGPDDDATVTFRDAPGDRGTEIHVELREDVPGGKAAELALKAVGRDPLAKVKDALRHFKQEVETGEISRSDAVPEGERAERKLKQRPAQPLDEPETEKAGV
jgi:uncharacterized membrane protein